MVGYTRDIILPEGDIIRVTLSEEQGIVSGAARQLAGNVRLMGVELQRVSGNNMIGLNALRAVEEFIADVFSKGNDAMIMYYCDFLNPIPRTNKNTMPPQKYRSLLFENMFRRYTRTKRIDDVCLSVVEVSGINETYFFHLIYRKFQSAEALIIANDIKEGYSK